MIERVEIELLVLEGVGELVHEGDADVGVAEVLAAHEECVLLLVVEADDVSGVEVTLRLDEVDRSRDEPERPQLAGVALGLSAVALAHLGVVALVRLHERLVGEELHRHGMIERELAVAFHEADVLRHPRIPLGRWARRRTGRWRDAERRRHQCGNDDDDADDDAGPRPPLLHRARVLVARSARSAGAGSAPRSAGAS